MQELLTGTIDSIYTKTLKIKNGPRAGQDTQVYHAMINGYDINLGFKCDHQEGETVSLTVENGRFGYELVKNPQAGAQPIAPAPTVSSASAPQTCKAPDFPVAKDSRGMTIARQNSGGHAARLVVALIDQGAVSTKDEAIEAFMEFAYQITDFATGHREINQAAAMQGYTEDK